MSLNLDLTQINDRFLDEWDLEAITTVFENSEAIDPDESQPFVRFSIRPGSRARVYGNGIHSQLGRVWLQILIPKADGDAKAFELADQFTAIFQDWRSNDGCLRTGDVDVQQYPRGENGMFQVNVSIQWESLRAL